MDRGSEARRQDDKNSNQQLEHWANTIFQSLEVVSSYRDPQPQVTENDLDLLNLKSPCT